MQIPEHVRREAEQVLANAYVPPDLNSPDIERDPPSEAARAALRADVKRMLAMAWTPGTPDEAAVVRADMEARHLLDVFKQMAVCARTEDDQREVNKIRDHADRLIDYVEEADPRLSL